MENNPQNENNEQPTEENNVIIESAGDDRAKLGIEEQESNDDAVNSDDQTKEQSEQEEAEKPKRKNRAQKKIERQNREIKELRAKLEQQESNRDGGQEEAEDLNIDDFETYDDYLEALEAQSEKKEPKAPKAEDEQPEVDNRVADMLEDGIEEYEDFEELVKAPDLALTQELLNNVLDSDMAADVAYYLATNKDKTKEISGLTSKQQQKAILKIELELESGEKKPKPNKVSKAPEPIEPVNGNSIDKRTPETSASYKEYETLRSKQAKNNGW